MSDSEYLLIHRCYILAFNEALFLLQMNFPSPVPPLSRERVMISNGVIILSRRTLMMYWCKINFQRICVPTVPRTNTLTAVLCLMGRAIHRQSVFGCELVLPLKSSAVIYNVRRRLPLTSLLSHSEPCLLALTNTTRDKTELGGEKLPTEISSLISWRCADNSKMRTHAMHMSAHGDSQHKRALTLSRHVIFHPTIKIKELFFA